MKSIPLVALSALALALAGPAAACNEAKSKDASVTHSHPKVAEATPKAAPPAQPAPAAADRKAKATRDKTQDESRKPG